MSRLLALRDWYGPAQTGAACESAVALLGPAAPWAYTIMRPRSPEICEPAARLISDRMNFTLSAPSTSDGRVEGQLGRRLRSGQSSSCARLVELHRRGNLTGCRR